MTVINNMRGQEFYYHSVHLVIHFWWLLVGIGWVYVADIWRVLVSVRDYFFNISYSGLYDKSFRNKLLVWLSMYW